MNRPVGKMAEPIHSSGWLWLVMALAFLLPSPALLAIPRELGKQNRAILPGRQLAETCRDTLVRLAGLSE